MHYFIGREGRQLGSFTEQQVRDQLAAGTVGYDDLIWCDGMTDWKPVRDIFRPSGPPPIPASGQAGLPPFRSAITHESPPAEPQLADRGKRLVAVLLDGLVNLVAVGPGIAWGVMSFATLGGNSLFDPTQSSQSHEALHLETLIMHLAFPVLAILVPLLGVLILQTWLLTSRGQTLGKKWMRIRIVRTDGSQPGFVHAILMRSFVIQLIGLIPIVGGVVSLIDPFLIFREDRRCLHDLLADTTVIEA